MFEPSVDKIVSQLTKLVNRLEDAVGHHLDQSGKHRADAEVSTKKADTHIKEAGRARGISERIKALLG